MPSSISSIQPEEPNKLHPYNIHPPPPPFRSRCSFTRQTKLLNQEICIPRDSPTPAFKLWCKCIKSATYVALTMVGATVVTGGFVVYAKSDPELRDWLTILIPTLDEVIAIATQESMTTSEFIALTKEYFGFDCPGDKSNACVEM